MRVGQNGKDKLRRLGCCPGGRNATPHVRFTRPVARVWQTRGSKPAIAVPAGSQARRMPALDGQRLDRNPADVRSGGYCKPGPGPAVRFGREAGRAGAAAGALQV